MLDGKIARKYNLVTNFGKFMDPLADKLLVCSAMICLIPSGKLNTAIVIVIIAREFIISGFRLVASDSGIVIAASYWGKFKTVFHWWRPTAGSSLRPATGASSRPCSRWP